MANEADVMAAWLKICRDDTTPNVGLVDLTGRLDPMVPWRSAKPAIIPVIALPFIPSVPTSRTPYSRAMTVRPEVRTPETTGDLWARILDRIEAISTHNAFAAEGLDIQVTPGPRFPGEAGDVEGYRMIAEYRLVVTV